MREATGKQTSLSKNTCVQKRVECIEFIKGGGRDDDDDTNKDDHDPDGDDDKVDEEDTDDEDDIEVDACFLRFVPGTCIQEVSTCF